MTAFASDFATANQELVLAPQDRFYRFPEPAGLVPYFCPFPMVSTNFEVLNVTWMIREGVQRLAEAVDATGYIFKKRCKCLRVSYSSTSHASV